MFKEELNELALEVRSEMGLTKLDRFDPFDWLRENGIVCCSVFDIEASTEALDHFTKHNPNKLSAILVRTRRGHLVIYNPRRSRVRVRSDVAHEVAHVVAEHDLETHLLGESGVCAASSKVQEREAAELSGALLVPRQVARDAAIRNVPAIELAHRFDVSLDMATWRMRVSGGYQIAKHLRARRAR